MQQAPTPELDLSQCEREPIHLLGGIQPQGVLLAFREEAPRPLVVVSANTEALLGLPPEAMLGAPIERVLPARELERLRTQGGLARVVLEGRAFNALLHTSDGLAVLELEALGREDAGLEESALAAVQQLVSPLSRTRGPGALLQATADAVRALTGFDRVMVYRFDADWHGEVLAESRREDVDSFLGMHFPASDIPAQARALYTRNPLRLIADVAAAPVPLVPAVLPALGRPLDLSGAALRSVSRVHIEYLRNMGVAASFSLSLLQEGRLWGLVACHHLRPRHVSAPRRRACEVLCQLLTLQLAAEERGAEAAERARRAELQGRLAVALGEGRPGELPGADPLPVALAQHGALLLELTHSRGAALLLGGGQPPLLVGQTPSSPEVEALGAWLASRPWPEGAAFHTDRLGTLYPPLAERAGVASGLLAVRLEPGAPRFALWFRPEVARTVTWAGNPRKPAEPEPGQARLHPRGSFAEWKETVRGVSPPWTRVDREAAEDFRGALVGVVLRQAEQLARLSRALARSNAELDAFGGTISHDLQEPLRGIRQFSDFLLEDWGEALGEEGRQQLSEVRWLARRSGEMLEDLFEYSRLARMELSWAEADLQELVEDVVRSLSARLEESRVEVRIPRRLPTLRCDAVRLRQVWANLVSNAAKYQTGEPRWVELGFLGPGEPRPEAARRREAPYVFYVKDPGIGIAAQFHEAIFEMFRRLHPSHAYGGGKGAGLAIARRLVELHGGALWVDSAPGQGATFYFTVGEGPR